VIEPSVREGADVVAGLHRLVSWMTER